MMYNLLSFLGGNLSTIQNRKHLFRTFFILLFFFFKLLFFFAACYDSRKTVAFGPIFFFSFAARFFLSIKPF